MQAGAGPGRVGGWLRLERTGPMIVARSEQRQALDPGAWALTTGELSSSRPTGGTDSHIPLDPC